MSAQYLVRFDDICPEMNWRVWAEIEAILVDSGVKPMLAVVPDNQDEKLKVDNPDRYFWERVRRWQSMGWTIGLHGFQHKYVTQEAGIIGLNKYSEFAGLPLAEQEQKLRAGLEIFAREGIKTDTWIAPAHSFDANTVDALYKVGLRVISDGFFLLPYRDERGVFWIPQQLWGFRRVSWGIWTVCFHHNKWTKEDIQRFRTDIEKYRQAITDVASVAERYGNRCRSHLDRLISRSWLAGIRAKRSLRMLVRR